jgi:hypothetical protein
MGMFDELYFNCPECDTQCYLQLKICRFPMLRQWRIGSPVDLDEVFPDYQRHIINWKDDRCPKCGAGFVFDCTSGYINVEVWNGEEELANPVKDYFWGMSIGLHYSLSTEAKHVLWLAKLLGDPEVGWFCPPPPDVDEWFED